MTRQNLITLLAADIKAYVLDNGGYFCVADDPAHPYAVLAAGNVRKWACILSFAGDGAAGEELPGHVPRVEVFVGHCVDLRKDPGAWLHVDTANTKSLLKRVDDVDGYIRLIAFAAEVAGDDDALTNYGGAQQVTLPGAGIPLRAYKLAYTWTLRLALDTEEQRTLNDEETP